MYFKTARNQWLCGHRKVRGLRGNQSIILQCSARGQAVEQSIDVQELARRNFQTSLRHEPAAPTKKACRPIIQVEQVKSASLSLFFYFRPLTLCKEDHSELPSSSHEQHRHRPLLLHRRDLFPSGAFVFGALPARRAHHRLPRTDRAAGSATIVVFFFNEAQWKQWTTPAGRRGWTGTNHAQTRTTFWHNRGDGTQPLPGLSGQLRPIGTALCRPSIPNARGGHHRT